MRALRVLATYAVAAALAACSGAAPDGATDAGPTAPPSALAPSDPTAADPADPASALGLVEGWGPSAGELDAAATLVAGLTLRELAGQVIVAPWSGTRAPTGLVGRHHLGGVIWFGDNVVSPAQVRRTNRALRRATADRGWPLLVGVDQEGGAVARLDRGVTRLPSFMTSGAARTPRLTRDVARASGRELRALGFTAVFAPVADVTIGPADPTIGARSASSSPAQAAVQALAASRGLADAGLVSPLKHFPGHGSVRADSHHTLPRQTVPLPRLRERDLRPFSEAVAGGASAVMLGHLDVRAVDPGVPSSLSRRVVDGLLRRDLGFQGLVVTDSLAMGAVARQPADRVAVRALRAGADVLLMPEDVSRAHAGVVRAVRAGVLPRRRLEQAAARQVALLLHHRAARGAPPGTARRAAAAWSRAAVTVATGPCSGRLVGRRVTPAGDARAVRAFVPAARAAGLRVGRGGTRVAFLRPGGRAVPAAVTVAVEAPWVLARSRSRVELAAYGDTPLAMRAVVRVLVGRDRAPGRLPVRVPGVARRGC
ncbi:glycoside hydrolase family 3 N-terminal domain-containing protein [Nocardioides solisilvae]|uniref:glycoside hydrolase family 3 N-terminal domain-containing protein n=1 Tax=Nocardioides solisilvae TaxID=1542435 RepID=UPI000D74E674|nr:glycoside hydrolase family 3 N-terminal domain-containing protein [Nocardioides solisilvae]